MVTGRICLALLGALATAAVVRAAAPAQGATGDVFPYPIHQSSLDNGFKIVVIPYESPGTIAFFTIVRTGSRDEVEAGHSGYAHLFEHMMFRGTPRYSQDRYTQVLKQMGADNNASTSDDFTEYHIIGPAAEIETMMDMESDRFKNLKYTEEQFRTEALAVLGEYNKDASNPGLPLEEKLRDVAFTAHTYKHTTIGFIADVKAMPNDYAYSVAFHDRFYRPENCTLVIVGDAKPEEVFALAKKFYGDWQPGYKPGTIASEPPQREPKSARLDWPNPTHPYLVEGYHIPSAAAVTPELAALDLIGPLLFGESAPLYQELVNDKQWVDFIEGGAEAHRDPYLFTVFVRAHSDELMPKIQEAIDRSLTALRTTPVDAARLERVKSHLRYAFALSLNTPTAVAYQVARALSIAGSVDWINKLFAQDQLVTPAEIQRVAGMIFRPENQTVVTLSHPDGASKPKKGQGGAQP